jgi:tripartite-type tricarboxylate transporter receptor subunit TctC
MARWLGTVLLCLSIAWSGAARAEAPKPAPATGPFSGKRVTVYIGSSPIGGVGYDTYGRVMAKYLGKYLPGHPSVVPENRPGAGGLTLTNYLYNSAQKDGTEIGLVLRGNAMDPLLNPQAAVADKFDATKMVWIGSMNNEVAGFYVTDKARDKTLADVLAGKELIVGSSGGGSDPQMFAVLMNSIFHTKLKIIGGYPGMNEILMGMKNGELEGVLGYSWSAARITSIDDLKSGAMKVIMQLALAKHADLPDVPLVTDLVKNDEDRKVLELIFARQSMGRPFVAPPVSPEIGAMLRKGFADAMHDPDLIAECEKINMEINFVGGEEIQSLVSRLYQFPAGVIERGKQIASQ